MIQPIICEVCRGRIGAVETDTLIMPLTAKQILSSDPDRNLPPPFHESLQPHQFRCPFGKYGDAGHNPFITEGELLTDIWNKKTKDFVRIRIGEPFRLVTDMASMNQELIDQLQSDFESTPGPKKRGPKKAPGNKNLTCDHCGKEFAHRSSKSRHMKTCPKRRT